jgi:hypothetical protein
MRTRNVLILAISLLMVTGAVNAQIEEIVPFSVVQSTVDSYLGAASGVNRSDKWISEGNTVYVVARRSSPTINWIVRLDDVDTSPVGTVLAQYNDSLITGASFNISGDDLIFAAAGPDSVFLLDKTDGTGGIRTYMSDADALAATGGDGLITGSSGLAPNGEMVTYETDMDQLIITDDNEPNNVKVYVSNADLVAGMGNDRVGGQLTWDAQGRMYMANSDHDSIWRYDPSQATPADQFEEIISEQQLFDFLNAINPADIVDLGDISGLVGNIYSPTDDLIYCFESASDYILSYDPADPLGTLAVVASEDDLRNSVANDILSYFSLYDGGVAFGTFLTETGYYTPEPASMSVLALAGLALIRRRR